MSRQLEIVVKGRDEASKIFKQVGDSATETGQRLSGLNDLAAAGKGLKSVLKQVKAIYIAFKVLPLGMDAVSAAWKTFTGTTEEAAAAQRQLLDGIKHFPIIGKPVAATAEYIGSALAHALGKQSTKEIEQELKAKEKALKDFQKSISKIGSLDERSTESANNAADELKAFNLGPSEFAIQKAKEKYQKAIDALKPLKSAVLSAAAAADKPEDFAKVREQTARIGHIQLEAQKALDSELALIRAKETQRKAEEHLKEEHEEQQHQLRLSEIQTSARAALLQAAGETELAAQAQAKNRYDAAVQAAEQKRDREAQEATKNHREDLIPGLNAALLDEKLALYKQFEQQISLSQQKDLDERRQRQDAIRKLEIQGRQEELEAEGQSAAARLFALKEGGRLEIAELDRQYREKATLQKAAGVTDDEARQEYEAKRAAVLRKNQVEQQKAGQDAALEAVKPQLFILQQEAELGDQTAQRQLKKLQIEQQFLAERQKVLAVLKDEKSTEEQKSAARKNLSDLGKVEQERLKRIGQKSGQGQLATLEDQFYLSGVAAAASQDKAQEPVVAELQNIGAKLDEWIRQQSAIQYQEIR